MKSILNKYRQTWCMLNVTREGAEALISRLERMGIQALTIDNSTIRIVTHLHITDDDVQRTISALDSAQL